MKMAKIVDEIDDSTYDKVIRIVICGAPKTGKSTMLHNFACDVVEAEDREIGVTTLKLEDLLVRIQAEKAEKWSDDFLLFFDGIAIVFATDDLASFEFARDMATLVPASFPCVLIENKIDLLDQSRVKKEIVEAEVKTLKRRLYRASGLREFNIMHPFSYLIERLTRGFKNSRSVQSPIQEDKRSTTSRIGWPEETKYKNDKCKIM